MNMKFDIAAKKKNKNDLIMHLVLWALMPKLWFGSPYESMDHSLLRPLLSSYSLRLATFSKCLLLEDLFAPSPLSSETRLDIVAFGDDGSNSRSSSSSTLSSSSAPGLAF